jgi:glycosyltransferase involved in cell wall biosynthesis
VFARAREQARRIDPGGSSILFSGWLPYAARADLYAAADLMVSISAEGLETELAYRTRLLDAAWGGLPSVTVGGGTLARELVAAGAAFESPRSPDALADRVAALLADAARRSRAGDAARRFASERNWSAVARPLLSWCREARIDANRLPAPRAAKESLLRRLFQ